MLASGLVLGIAAGWLSGGRPARLATLPIRWWPILGAAMAVRLSAPLAGDAAAAVYVAAFAGIVAVALANLSLPGMPFIAAGAAMNFVVVAANGGMPVDPLAIETAGAVMPGDHLHLPMTDGTRLPVLADVLPIPLFRSVYSFGDVLLAVGAFWLPFAWMRRA